MLAFDLVGGWTSPTLLLRTLTLGSPKWEPLRAGFTHRETGERVSLTMSPASPPLAGSFAAGVDPFRPTIDADLLDEIATHQAVVSVSVAPGPTAAITLVRAADAVVNAGALAIRCRTSGLAHGADGFLLLAAAIEAAVAAGDPQEALFDVYVQVRPGNRPHTLGMHALGAPDVALPTGGDPEVDLPRLRAAAIATLRGTAPSDLRPDDRGLPAAMVNPHGVHTVR